MHVVLVEPEIAPNTGNVARLCAATRSTLHLIEPFGFRLDDAQLKRAGMDYWQQVEWRRWPDWAAFTVGLTAEARLWFVESNGPVRYSDARFLPTDYLVFGRETAGLPRAAPGVAPRSLAADSHVQPRGALAQPRELRRAGSV